jgi:hypothetical protein
MPKRKADSLERPRRAAKQLFIEGACNPPRRPFSLSTAAKQLYIDFDWDEAEVELPDGHVAIVHVWDGYVDVSFEGPEAHTLDDLVEDAEAEVRNRLESCAPLPPGDHVVFRTRPGEGLLEQATHLTL